ncbi:MAG: HEAT repeat domain-containing protein [Anaerolineae bacterium]|nr:HEAT repeat domain-containing protein [Anaerolineae bacterium]
MSAGALIYLSYSKYETDFALKLATDLKNAGVNIWCDRLRITAGDDLLPTLKSALNDASTVICAVSGNYLNAQYARHEWEHARKKQKMLLPIVVASMDGITTPRELGLHRAIDFSGWRDESLYQAALSRLLRLFGPIPEGFIPSHEDIYLNSLVGLLERRMAVQEILDPPDQTNSQTARARLRPLSSLEPVWGKLGDVRVVRGGEGLQDGALLTLQQAVRMSGRFALIGGPGCGKSTVLNRLALDAAYAYRAQPDDNPLPLLIDLSEYPAGMSLVECIESAWPLDIDVWQQVKRGTVALYIDELDALSLDNSRAGELQSLLDGENSPHTLVVAANAAPVAKLPTCELLSLSDADIRRYAETYLGGTAKPLLEQLFAGSQADGSESELLRLARVPALLTGFIFLHRSSPQNTLPTSLGALYKRLLPSMWVWWRLAQAPIAVAYRELVPSLEKLALAMFDQGKSSLSLDDAGMLLYDPSVLSLRAASAMNVVEIRQGKLRFKHRLLRDFYASLHLTPLDISVRLQRPQFTPDGLRIAGKWDIPLHMMSGFMPASDALVRTVAEVDAYLAAECVAFGAQVTPFVLELIVENLLNDVDEPERHAAIQHSLALLSTPAVLPAILERLQSRSLVMRAAAAWAIKELNVPLPTALVKALKNWDWSPNESTAEIFRNTTSRDETFAALITMLGDSEAVRRRGAAWALGVMGERAAVGALQAALNDSSDSVKDMAAKALKELTAQAAAVPAYNEELVAADGIPPAAPAKPMSQRTVILPVGHKSAQSSASAPPVKRPSNPLARSGGARSSSASVLKDRLMRKSEEGAASSEVSDLLKNLWDKDWETRQTAVERLGHLGDESVVMPLLETLNDEDEQVRFAAVRALGNYSSETAAQGLLSALHDPILIVKDAAGEELGKMNGYALPGLMSLIHDPALDADTRGVVIETIGRIADPSAVEVLIACLEDESAPRMEEWRICDLAAAALERIGTPEAQDAVAEWRREQQPTEQFNPAIIADIDENDDIASDRLSLAPPVSPDLEAQTRILVEALRVSDTHQQHAAAKALREFARELSVQNIDDNRVVYALADALRDNDAVIRWAVVEAIAWLQDSSALPILHEALHDKHFTVRLAAIRALQEIGDKNAVWALLDRLDDENPVVREKAAEALGYLGSQDVVVRLARLLQDEDEFVRRASVVSLGIIGSTEVSPQLLEALDDPELLVQWAAMEALGKLGEPAAVDALARRLNDDYKPSWDDRRVSKIAETALERIPVPEAVSALQQWRSRQVSTPE